MNGIFCIETPWEYPNVSVKHALKFVATYHNAPIEHRVAETPERLNDHLESWADRSDWTYPILYLGFHGFDKGIQANSGEPGRSLWDFVRLEQLADFSKGQWKNCVVHFASCSTMRTDAAGVEEFLQQTGLEGVSGYTTDVEWIESMAFEVMYLTYLLEQVGNHYVKADHLRLCRDKLANSPYAKALSEVLGFSLKVREG